MPSEWMVETVCQDPNQLSVKTSGGSGRGRGSKYGLWKRRKNNIGLLLMAAIRNKRAISSVIGSLSMQAITSRRTVS